MKKILLTSVFVASFALLAACGDDSSSGPAEESSSSIEAEEESSSGGETSSSSSSHSEEDGDESSSSHSEEGDGEESSSSQSGDVSPESSAMSSSAEIEEPESSSSNVIASSSSAKQSSSSEEESSSSEALQSSSSDEVGEVKPSGYYKDNCPSGHTCTDAAPSTYLKSGITYGEILDTRDYQVYKVVTIGEGDGAQTWMAQNLNYDPGDVSSMGSSAWSGCYGVGGYDNVSQSNLDEAQVAENCSKYGRLYTWKVAMDKAGCGYENDCNNSYEGTQGICPEGWHLPSHSEWQTLFAYVVISTTSWTALKSTSGWNGDGNGYDAYGFSALPAGRRGNEGDFDDAGYYAGFWSSSEDSGYDAYYVYLDYDVVDALYYGDKNLAFSVRCLRN